MNATSFCFARTSLWTTYLHCTTIVPYKGHGRGFKACFHKPSHTIPYSSLHLERWGKSVHTTDPLNSRPRRLAEPFSAKNIKKQRKTANFREIRGFKNANSPFYSVNSAFTHKKRHNFQQLKMEACFNTEISRFFAVFRLFWSIFVKNGGLPRPRDSRFQSCNVHSPPLPIFRTVCIQCVCRRWKIIEYSTVP